MWLKHADCEHAFPFSAARAGGRASPCLLLLCDSETGLVLRLAEATWVWGRSQVQTEPLDEVELEAAREGCGPGRRRQAAWSRTFVISFVMPPVEGEMV